MGSLSSGTADGLQDMRSREAEASAWRSQVALSSEKKRGRVVSAQATNLEMVNGVLRENLKAVVEQRDQGTARTSAGMVVINQMMKLIEGLPAAEQQRFRDRLAEMSIARMRQLDDEHRGKESFLDIEKNFRSMSNEFHLGVV